MHKLKSSRGNHSPVINKEVSRAIRKRIELYSKYL